MEGLPPTAPGAAGPPESTVPLVGRAVETAALTDALDEAASGLGRIVLIEGEAGIGKTRLVQEAVRAATADGFAVFAAGADEVEQRRPFGVVIDALGLTRTPDDPARAALAGALHGENQPTAAAGHLDQAGEADFRAREAVVELVERFCARSRVLLVLENLHWADPSTLSCLERLSRVCGQLPLLVLATARRLSYSTELTRVLYDLGNRGAIRIALGPLDAEQLPVLAEAVVGAPPGPNLRAQLSRAGGNPLLALELLAALRLDGSLGSTDRVAEVGEFSAAVAPSLTILHRLSFLTPETLEILGMASILGSTFSVADLCLVSGCTAAELAEPLREALAAGALAERDDRLAFRHELIRDVLYADLPANLRGSLHRGLAWALAQAGAPPGRVAEHLLRGVQPGDDEAVEWLRRAAEEAGRRAPAVAVELLDHALALADPSSPIRGRLAADRAMALIWSGRSEEGENACQEVLARGDDPEREDSLRWLLLWTMLTRGRVAESLEHIDEAMRIHTAAPAERALYRGVAAFARLRQGRLAVALELAEDAVALAQPTGDAHALVEALHAKVQVLSFQGRFVEAATLGLQAVQALDADQVPRGAQTVTATTGLMLIATDRTVEGREMLLRGRQLNESLGARSGLALHHVVHADGLFLLGEWDDAIAEIEAGAELLGDESAWPAMSLGVLALIAVHRDDPAGARAHLAAARAAAPMSSGQMRDHRTVLAGALLAESAGRNGAALAQLNAGWDRLAAAGIGAGTPELGPELVRRLVAAGDAERAAEVAAAVVRCCAHNPGVPDIEGSTLLCQGLIQSSPDLLIDAVGAYRRGAQPLGRALACADAAAGLARAGHHEQARALLVESRGVYERIGAYRSAVRTRAALAELGVRDGDTTPRQWRKTGWAALTATERKVVALVAQRLSNPEIAERMVLSRRTVESHVSHILRKVGLHSRVALGAEAARRGF